MAIKRILVPVDFSDSSFTALAYTHEFAKPFKAELVILHVIEPIYYATPADMYATSANLAMLLDEQRRLSSTQLARLSADLKKKRLRHRTLLKTGSPAQVIVDSAKSARADLIIMSTHGRTGLAHILLGSVTEKVVRGASCPVLTLRRGVVKKPKSTGKKRTVIRRV